MPGRISTKATAPRSSRITGSAVVTSNVWHHVAATYDGTWKLYLDGALDASLAVGQPPRSDSIQHAALGTAMNSTGVAAGFFQGVIDEARIWNVARTQAQIQASKDLEITSAPGLIGRWGLNEGAGTLASTCPSPAHQIELDLAPDAPSQFVMEPPGYQLHAWDPLSGVVSHTAYIGAFDGPYPFYDENGLID